MIQILVLVKIRQRMGLLRNEHGVVWKSGVKSGRSGDTRRMKFD